MDRSLTPKQERFCQEYSVDFNGTQAAIRAGYSKKTAQEQSSRLLLKVIVQNRIKELSQILTESVQITKEQLVAELAKIAFFDIRKIHTVDGGFKNIHDLGDDEAAAIAGIETFNETEKETGELLGTVNKIKISPKIQAIERISKMLGYDAPEKREINNTGQVTIFKLPDNGRG